MENNMKKKNKYLILILFILLFLILSTICIFADDTGDKISISNAFEETWLHARGEIINVVNNVIFPIIDTILAITFFIKLTLTYLDYRKTGKFEWTGIAILLLSLIFSLTCPLYLWEII